MSALESLNILDLRQLLPRNPAADPDLGVHAAKTSNTLHYNGPSVRGAGNRDQEIHQLIMDASYHIGKIWGYSGKRALYGNGIMYHFAVLSDGTIAQLRNLDCILWHCANGHGNIESMSVHLPLGDLQHPTPQQWQRLGLLFDCLIADYGMGGRDHVLGHTEWPKFDAEGHQVPNSACPGSVLLPMLHAWRVGQAAPVIELPAAGTELHYRVAAPDGTGANIRTAPRLDAALAPIASWEPQGAALTFDKLLPDENDGEARMWGHLVDQRGFVSTLILEAA